MSVRFPNIFGEDVVVYTDGLCFNKQSTKKISNVSYLTEGIWYFSFDYRLSIYTANEIFNNNFLDITNRISVPKNTFLFLEKEIEVPPMMAGMETELYYDITFYNEESIIRLLQKNIALAKKGNLNCWKSSIELIDFIYKE
jgi:hypothetical protein